MANKNSSYVQSLVSFILDTKPYHSKLTEIVEEYRFSDEMTVNMTDRLFSSVMTKAAWSYSHFANGISNPAPLTAIHRVLSPQFRGMALNNTLFDNRGAFKVNRDENTDLPLVPLAFDPTSIQGVGLADAFVQRNGNGTQNEALLEGHDVFLSHGAYVFQITQTLNSNSAYAPRYVERRNEGLLAHATSFIQAQALDVSNPSSAINRIQAILTAIAAQLMSTPDVLSSTELAAVQAVVDTNVLPSTYEGLIGALKAANPPVISGFSSWDEVAGALAEYSPSMYFNTYTDVGHRETGAIAYYPVLDRHDAVITNIVPNASRPNYDEISIVGVSPTAYFVRGSHTGLIGSGTFPGSFSSTHISFDIAPPYSQEFTVDDGPYPVQVTLPFSDSTLTISGPATQVGVDTIEVSGPGTVTAALPLTDVEIVLTPSSKIAVHEDAPLEAWSIIKVNPLAYSRPVLTSERYGYIMNAGAQKHLITILDPSFPTGTVEIVALDNLTFSVKTTGEPSYNEIATVGQVFNDGRLQFTIVAGNAYTFQAGDSFYVEVLNNPAVPADLDLYYGYDMDPYDGAEYVYDAVNTAVADYLKTLDFGWDSRFTSYDLASFDLQITQAAVGGREWRLRAIPNITRPLPQRPPSDNRVNQSMNEGAPVFDGDGNSTTDIRLYYADSFALEYYNIGTSTWTSVSTVPVGSSYSSSTHGLSFNLVEAAKPFVAGQVNGDGMSLDGGDVIYWSIQNEAPKQLEASTLSSVRIPRLVMHGDSFHNAVPANWTLSWVAHRTYEIQGYHTGGPQNGQAVLSTPITVNMSTDGRSFFNPELGLHWTVVEGAGGLAPNDHFTFETFERKPMFLVHGSVSGWQANAEMDRWYWNGKIGFKIHSPDVALFENDLKIDGSPWVTSVGTVTLEGVRRDSESAVYILRSHVDGHWTMYRNGEVVADGETVLQDKYLRLTMPAGVAGTVLKLDVVADDFQYTLGHDLAIVRTSPGRAPTADDFVLFSRTKQDDIKISVRPKDPDHAAVLSDLAPSTVDVRFVDHTTGSGVPLSVTSPETAVLPGWIPALLTPFDSALSIAEFSDPATHLVVRAAATGEKIGTVESIGPTPVEPVIFRWDSAFAAKYLPLNTEATIVTYGSGMNDRVHVNMSEGISFLIGSSGLLEDALFKDEINVAIAEDNQWLITMNYNTDVTAAVADGPFGGFLPGYDNMPYDQEDGVDGYYDAGQALTDQFQTARTLALQNVITPQEQAQLNDLIGLLYTFLVNGDPAQTTLEQFTAALDADPLINFTPQLFGFGVPAIGMGMQIEQTNGNTASTSIVEAMTVTALDAGYTFDQFGFDVGPMDTEPETTVMLFSSDAPPLPPTGLPPGSVTYDDFETPLFIPAPGGRVIEISFAAAVVATPQFYIWRPAEAAPSVVPVVERVTSRQFRFTIPAASELKLVIG